MKAHNMKSRILGQKKGVEMTLPIVVGIVIALVVLVIMIYMLTSRSSILAKSTSCEDKMCVTSGDDCSNLGNYEPGLTVCTKTVNVDGKDKKVVGRCCVPADG